MEDQWIRDNGEPNEFYKTSTMNNVNLKKKKLS